MLNATEYTEEQLYADGETAFTEQVDWSFSREIPKEEVKSRFLLGASTSQFYSNDKYLLATYDFFQAKGINDFYVFSSGILELYNIAIENQCSQEVLAELKKGPQFLQESALSSIKDFRAKALSKQEKWKKYNIDFINEINKQKPVLEDPNIVSRLLDLELFITNKRYAFPKRWKTFNDEYNKPIKSPKNNTSADTKSFKQAIDEEARHYLERRKRSYLIAKVENYLKLIYGIESFDIGRLNQAQKVHFAEAFKEFSEQAESIYNNDTAFECAVLYKLVETTLFYTITKYLNIHFFAYPSKISPAVSAMHERFIAPEIGKGFFQWLGLESEAVKKEKEQQNLKIEEFKMLVQQIEEVKNFHQRLPKEQPETNMASIAGKAAQPYTLEDTPSPMHSSPPGSITGSPKKQGIAQVKQEHDEKLVVEVDKKMFQDMFNVYREHRIKLLEQELQNSFSYKFFNKTAAKLDFETGDERNLTSPYVSPVTPSEEGVAYVVPGNNSDNRHKGIAKRQGSTGNISESSSSSSEGAEPEMAYFPSSSPDETDNLKVSSHLKNNFFKQESVSDSYTKPLNFHQQVELSDDLFSNILERLRSDVKPVIPKTTSNFNSNHRIFKSEDKIGDGNLNAPKTITIGNEDELSNEYENPNVDALSPKPNSGSCTIL